MKRLFLLRPSRIDKPISLAEVRSESTVSSREAQISTSSTAEQVATEVGPRPQSFVRSPLHSCAIPGWRRKRRGSGLAL